MEDVITNRTDWCLRRVRRTVALLLEEETRRETVGYLAHHSYWLIVPHVRRALRASSAPPGGNRAR